MTRIGDAIKREREACEASQTGVAYDARISRAYLANIEAGRALPSVDALLGIANVFADVDTAEWCWELLADTWGEPIADLMRKHAVAGSPRSRATDGEG